MHKEPNTMGKCDPLGPDLYPVDQRGFSRGRINDIAQRIDGSER